MLTQKAKYAIKAITYLAQKGELTKTQEISEGAMIPRKFLESILLELKSRQLVGSHQGAAGGYFLLKNPSEISLADMHRMFEGPIALLYCASLNFYQPCTDCADVENCKLKLALINVRTKTLEAMEGITIDQLINAGD